MKVRTLLGVVAAVLIVVAMASAQQLKMNDRPRVRVAHTAQDFPVTQLDVKAWLRADETHIKTYWSGATAPAGRHFTARVLWSDTAIYVRFEANQAELLVVSGKPDLSKKRMNLWDLDVCEIFIAPDPKTPNKYFEFEVAPTGEWLDVGIEMLPDKRLSDWEYRSGMQTAAQTDEGKVVMGIKVPWAAFDRTPKPGDTWLGNLLRCVGRGPGRGYLAWSPTFTESPNFHVPERFGEFEFIG